jgi:hypothetical protein
MLLSNGKNESERRIPASDNPNGIASSSPAVARLRVTLGKKSPDIPRHFRAERGEQKRVSFPITRIYAGKFPPQTWFLQMGTWTYANSLLYHHRRKK